MSTWNSAFEATPAGADDASLGDDKIRELKGAIRERLEKEHMMDLSTGTAAADGWHESGSAKVYTGTSNPTVRPDGTTALTAADDGRLFVNTTTNKVYCYKHGTGWVLVGIAEMPIGTMYIQFYDETVPATLFGGTWSNVSSTYAGLFFRAEESGVATWGTDQAANLSAHTHGVSITSGSTAPATSTDLRYSTISYTAGASTKVVLDGPVTGGTLLAVAGTCAAHTHAVTGTTASTGTGTDLRPKCAVVRIWKRVS